MISTEESSDAFDSLSFGCKLHRVSFFVISTFKRFNAKLKW